MRLFVALSPPAAALGELEQAVAPLRTIQPDLRWTSPGSWHITLAFLGEVDEAVLDRLTVRLEHAAARHPGLTLSAAGGGAFPTAPRARVLWTGLHADLHSLRTTAAAVAKGARKAGAPPPDGQRRFRPHITLARSREPTNVSGLVAELAGYSGMTWPADRVHLIRSHLGPDPWYESIGDWPLKAPVRQPTEAGLGDRPAGAGA